MSELQPTRGFLGMPKLPLAGVRVRTVAVILDIIIIVTGIHLLSRTFGDFLWSIGEWAPYLTGGFSFLYFALLNGPFGRGRTVGKIILGIAVTDYEGNFPTLRQSVIRTVILFPMYVTAPLATVIFGQIGSLWEGYWYQLLYSAPMLCVFIATPITVAFNPFKQGIHDYFAKTLVRPLKNVTVVPTFTELRELLGQSWPRLYVQPQLSGGVTVALLLLGIALLSNPSQFPQDRIRQSEGSFAINKIPGFEKVGIFPGIDFPLELKDYRDGMKTSGEVEEKVLHPRTFDEPTTGTVTFIVRVVRPDPWPADPTGASYLDSTQKLSEVYYQEIFLPGVETMAASKSEELRKRAESYQGKPLRFYFQFLSAARLSPYPSGIVKIEYEWVKDYPPLQFKTTKTPS